MSQLSMTEIKKENQIYKEIVDIDVTVGGKEYIIKFYPFFSPERVHKVFQSMADFFESAKKEKLNIPDDEFDGLLGYFLVREFTDIKMTGSRKAKTIYAEYKEAINSRLFDIILKSIPEESMNYVYEKLYERQEVMAKLQNQFEKLQQELKDYPFENRDILFPKTKLETKLENNIQ